METYNRDELLDYLTTIEIGTLSEVETPDCVKHRYTKAWIAKRNFIDNWLKQVQNKQQDVAKMRCEKEDLSIVWPTLPRSQNATLPNLVRGC